LRFPFSTSRAGIFPETSEDASKDVSEQAAALPQAAKRRVLPIHPVLFAAFPILALFVHNMGQVPLWEMLWPLGLALLGTFAVWALFLLLTRKPRKAAIAASAIVVAFFSYGHLVDLLPPALRLLVAPVCVLGLVALLIAVLKTRHALLDATAILNLMSVALVVAPLWAIGASLWNAPRVSKPSHDDMGSVSLSGAGRAPTAISPPRRLPTAAANLPDVYYIILDAYGRADRLNLFYGYDNTPFLKALQQRGFYIAPRSRANYDQTPLCLASALNMNYLDNAQNQLAPEFLRQMVDDNAVAAYLRKFGYHYVSIWSGLEVSRVVTADTVFNNQPDLTRFEGQTLSLTPLGATSKVQHDRFDRHRERLLGVFDSLDTAAQLPYTKFVFAHLIAPHPPFVFGANGEAVYPKGALDFSDASWLLKQITREEYKSRYIAQLQYVNKRVLKAVDAILRQSRRPPIIIIQGDHGSRMNLDWESLENTDLREPFSILNAYHVPAKMRGALYDTITPVNSFRVLLTSLFGAKYARLPDRSFYSTASHPFDFTDVTALIRK
jgi:hypothetical protein